MSKSEDMKGDLRTYMCVWWRENRVLIGMSSTSSLYGYVSAVLMHNNFTSSETYTFFVSCIMKYVMWN